MRIIVNGIPLLTPKSGVGNYIYQNFKAMSKIATEVECSFYYGVEWSSKIRDRPVEPYISGRKVIKNFRSAYPAYRATLDMLFGIGQWWRKYDLYHETNYIPMQFNGPIVVTVFDLSFLLFPETHPKERVQYMERYFYSRLNRISHFITISETIKREMIEYLGIHKDKITITPLGVDNEFKPLLSEPLDPVVKKYGLKAGSYILNVGTLEPRKNVLNLLRAYARLPLFLRETYPLVLSGGAGWLMEKLDKEIQQLNIQKTVMKTGYVPNHDLPHLYSGATIFIYPSMYEGFGLPPLEAMACGTPVIASNISALVEVIGTAGVLVSPDDYEALAEKMQELLMNPARRQTLSAMGLQQSKHFTWEKCAAKTLEVYNHVVQDK